MSLLLDLFGSTEWLQLEAGQASREGDQSGYTRRGVLWPAGSERLVNQSAWLER